MLLPAMAEELVPSFIVAVAAAIFRDGKVLAMRRSPDKDAGPGLWETLSGRINEGEEPLAAAHREIFEETGLEVQVDPRPVTAYAANRLGRPMIVILYRGEHAGGEVRMSEEHDSHEWLTPEAFSTRTSLSTLADAVTQAAATPPYRSDD